MNGDLRSAAGDLAAWARRLEEGAERYRELRGRMSALTVTERSADRTVAVTVDADGCTVGIELAPAARGADPAALAAELLACTRRAQARLRREVTGLVHDTVGAEAAGAAVVEQYARRFPDAAPADPPPQPVTPPPRVPPPVAPPRPASRTPDRDRVVIPDEPDEEDLYYRRKSWLE